MEKSQVKGKRNHENKSKVGFNQKSKKGMTPHKKTNNKVNIFSHLDAELSY